MKQLRYFSLMLALVVSLAACKKSVEGEQKRWDSNKSKLNSLATKYPSYSSVIEEQKTKAEKLWKDAEGMSGEEDKIKKMAEANALLDRGFIGKLNSIEYKKDAIDRKQRNLARKRMSRTLSQRYNDASYDVSDARNLLIKSVRSEDEALRNTEEAYRLMTRAESTLSKIEKDLKGDKNTNNNSYRDNTNNSNRSDQNSGGRSTNRSTDNDRRSGDAAR